MMLSAHVRWAVQKKTSSLHLINIHLVIKLANLTYCQPQPLSAFYTLQVSHACFAIPRDFVPIVPKLDVMHCLRDWMEKERWTVPEEIDT